VLLGTAEDNTASESVFGAYLQFAMDEGAAKRDIVSFARLKQEFLPLLHSLYPTWEVFERRRKGRRKTGLSNIQINKDINRVAPANPESSFSAYKLEPFGLSVDQTHDGRCSVAAPAGCWSIKIS